MSHDRRRGVALAASVFGFSFLLALFPMRCLDTWWHLANGREIAQGNGIPRDNHYSFTFPEHAVTPTHWLFGLGAYVVHSIGGVSGLVLVKAIIIGATFLLSYLLALRRGALPAVAAVCVALATLASRTRFLERPHVFTMLGLIIFAWLVQVAKDGRPRAVWAVPPLAALWANLHAGALFGVGLVGIATCDALVSWPRARGADDANAEDVAARRAHARLMVLVSCASLVTVMLSPVGWGIYTYNLWHVNLDAVIPLVEFRTTLPQEYPIFYLILLTAVAALAFDRARTTVEATLTVAVLGAGGVFSVRGVPNFVLLAAPVAASGLTRIWKARSTRPAVARVDACLRRVPVEVLSTMLLLLPFAGHVAGGPWGKYRIGVGTARAFFPEGAVRFVAEHVPGRRVFNDLSAGGYLAWHWYPERRIFVDGRTNAYPPAFLKNLYHDVLTDAAVDLQVRAWSIDAALIHFYRGRNPFWPHFDLDRWTPVYADDASVVLLLRTPRNREAIERWQTRLGPHGLRALSDRLTPLGDAHTHRAAVAAHRALALADEARPPFTSRQRARLLHRSAHGMRMGREYEEAISRYREALRIVPDFVEARVNLGWALLDSGDHEAARSEFERALADGPRRSTALLGLARALLAMDETDAAKPLLREVIDDESAADGLRKRARDALEK